MLALHRDRSGDHPRVLLLEKAFWTLVIAVLALLVGGLLLAPGRLLSSASFVVLLVACVVLWTLHSLQLASHRDEVRQDPALHQARERRGF